MAKYRVTFEFDLADKASDDDAYNSNPVTWDWTELIDIDDVYTTADWNTFRVGDTNG